MKKSILIVCIVCIVSLVLTATVIYDRKAYPPMLFERGIDVNRTLNIVHKINPLFMNGLKTITFHNHDQSETYTKLGYYGFSTYRNRHYDKHIEIYYTMYDFTDDSFLCLLYHEIGHHDGLTYHNNISEEYADSFALKHRCMLDKYGEPTIDYTFQTYTYYIGNLEPGNNTIKGRYTDG